MSIEKDLDVLFVVNQIDTFPEEILQNIEQGGRRNIQQPGPIVVGI